MQKVRGWIYVGKKSASFISEERHYLADQLDWRILSDEKKFQSFRNTVPLRIEDSKNSYQTYFVETTSSVLKNWFATNSGGL